MNDTEFNIDVAAFYGVTVVAVRGAVDARTAPTLSAAFAVIENSRHLALDLSKVEFMDSSGLNALLVKAEQMRPQGGVLVITSASVQVHQLLEYANLNSLLNVDEPPRRSMTRPAGWR